MCNKWHLFINFRIWSSRSTAILWSQPIQRWIVNGILSCCVCESLSHCKNYPLSPHFLCSLIRKFNWNQTRPECSTSLLISHHWIIWTDCLLWTSTRTFKLTVNINSMVISLSVSFFYTHVTLTWTFDFQVFIKINILITYFWYFKILFHSYTCV